MPQASGRVIKKKFEKSINKPLIKNYIFNISRPFQLTFLTGFGCWPKALTARVWLQYKVNISFK